MNHITPYANELSRRGHSCAVALERFDSNAEGLKSNSLYSSVSYDEIRKNSKLLFPNSKPADVIYAWTPRENVRLLVEDYRDKHPGTIILIHLEDNEDSILENYYSTPIDRLRFPTKGQKELDWNPRLSHPNHYRRFLWEADAITTLTPSLVKLLPTPKPNINISPVLDPKEHTSIATAKEIRSKHNIPVDKKLIVYPGGVTSNNREDIRNLYLAVRLLQDSGTPAFIAKIGPNCPDLEGSFDFELDQVRIDLGILERRDVNELLNCADLLIQPGKDTEFNRDRFPCKIPEFLLSGCPCIIPEFYSEHLSSDRDICHLAPCGTPQQIMTACQQVFADYDSAKLKTKKAVEFVKKKYSSQENGDKLVQFIQQVQDRAKKEKTKPYALDGDFRNKYLQSHTLLKSTEQDVVKLNQDIRSFQEERSALKEEVEKLRLEKERLASKQARMEKTFSWRSTAPFRFLRRKLIDPFRKRAADKEENNSVAVEAEPKAIGNQPPPEHPCYHKGYHAFVQSEIARQPEMLSELRDKVDALEKKPKFSILLPVYDVAEIWLRECIDSVLRQTYPNWELCIADDASPSPHVRRTIESYVASDSRIKATFREKNGHISAASNSAFELATGEYIALLDHDDSIPDHALARVAIAISENPQAKLIYSDEDKIDEEGIRHDPHFKTDWNYDLFLGCNMISHLGVYERKAYELAGGFRLGFEGAQDWDLALRIIEKCEPEEIIHIPEVLYHWRSIIGSTAAGIEHKNYAYPAQKRAIESHLKRIGISAKVESVRAVNWRVAYEIPEDPPKVSIIIPTKDQLHHLQACIESITIKTTYPNYEIVVADNGSTEPATIDYFQNIREESHIRILEMPGDFNYSKINNQAILQTDTPLICLLNNDTEVIDGSWLHEMVRHSLRKEIGVVGAKLLFPHDHVQHCGIILGIYDIAGHAFKFLHKNDNGHVGRAKLVSAYSAVTGACMLFRRKIWEEIGGFNETQLPISYNDVDFCLRSGEAGYKTIITPFATLYHKESVSRGPETSESQILRFENESEYMRKRWSELIKEDPFYNRNLTQTKEDFSFRQS